MHPQAAHPRTSLRQVRPRHARATPAPRPRHARATRLRPQAGAWDACSSCLRQEAGRKWILKLGKFLPEAGGRQELNSGAGKAPA
eukprot:gene12691-biopygen1521